MDSLIGHTHEAGVQPQQPSTTAGFKSFKKIYLRTSEIEEKLADIGSQFMTSVRASGTGNRCENYVKEFR
jgi:hypothetical protein